MYTLAYLVVFVAVDPRRVVLDVFKKHLGDPSLDRVAQAEHVVHLRVEPTCERLGAVIGKLIQPCTTQDKCVTIYLHAHAVLRKFRVPIEVFDVRDCMLWADQVPATRVVRLYVHHAEVVADVVSKIVRYRFKRIVDKDDKLIRSLQSLQRSERHLCEINVTAVSVHNKISHFGSFL